MHSCKVKECKVCSAAISYIAGFYAFSLSKRLKCGPCKDALHNSDEDRCPDRSLILMKNYFQDNDEKGLSYPSGSLCQLLYQAEEFFRKCVVNSGSSVERFTVYFLQNMGRMDFFPSLQLRHSFETSYGTENHYTSLIHLILKKYFALRLKNSLKNASLEKKFGGNAIHRARIFSNV